VGYTYFDQKTGHEFSAVTGLTYNFINPSTNYQNGVDWHLDWAASQFLSQQFSVGIVGYVYKEIGCDSGSGDRLGCFQSQVVGIGPQLTFLPGRKYAGLSELKRLQGICCAEPTRWLECVADVRNFPGRAQPRVFGFSG
jgi:hypothetical protein